MTILYKYLAGFAILFSVLFGAYTWHLAVVKVEVSKAETALEKKHTLELLAQANKAKEQSRKLQNEKEKLDAEHKKTLSAVTAKYNNLREWVSNLPNKSDSNTDSRSTEHTENRSEDIIGELRRSHGKELAEYSYDAEKMRQGLLACYKQYEEVKHLLDNIK